MLNFLKKNKPDAPIFTGAIDPGAVHNLAQFSEVVTAPAPVNWQPLDVSKLPSYKVRNQNGSGGCVSFTTALMASIVYFVRTGVWVDFSPAWVYSQRTNKPQEGMIGTDAFSIASKGMLPDVLMPSDNLSDDSLSNPKQQAWYSKVAEVFSFGDDQPVILPVGDIESLASVIQETGKPVMVWFSFGTGEWVAVPKIISTNAPYKHSVTAIPPQAGEMTYGMYNGEKAIVIQDSWGQISNMFDGKRVITESFYKARNAFAAYTMRFKFDIPNTGKPHYDGSVASLQDCLTYEGVFPSNIKARGTYGSITTDAVKKFQAKYGLEQVGVTGPKTTELLKKLYP